VPDEHTQGGIRGRIAQLNRAAERLLLCHLDGEHAFRVVIHALAATRAGDLERACDDAESVAARLKAPLRRLSDAVAGVEKEVASRAKAVAEAAHALSEADRQQLRTRVETARTWHLALVTLRDAAQATYDRSVARHALLVGALCRANEIANTTRETMNSRAFDDDLMASFSCGTIEGVRKRQRNQSHATDSEGRGDSAKRQRAAVGVE